MCSSVHCHTSMESPLRTATGVTLFCRNGQRCGQELKTNCYIKTNVAMLQYLVQLAAHQLFTPNSQQQGHPGPPYLQRIQTSGENMHRGNTDSASGSSVTESNIHHCSQTPPTNTIRVRGSVKLSTSRTSSQSFKRCGELAITVK